jgi:hypothetical protein
MKDALVFTQAALKDRVAKTDTQRKAEPRFDYSTRSQTPVDIPSELHGPLLYPLCTRSKAPERDLIESTWQGLIQSLRTFVSSLRTFE